MFEAAVELTRESPLPVIWMRKIADVEQWLTHQDVKAVFYVNQNMRNFQMLRFREPADRL